VDPLAEREYWQIIWDNFQKGDRDAFQTIYNEYVDALFSYGIRITKHRALVEDAIQDVFIDIYSYGSVLRKPESLEYYLFKSLKRIIYKKLKEKYRFTHPEQFIEQFDLKFPIEEAEQEISDENLIKLKNELQHLNVKKRELLFLKFNSGLTYKEIGKLIGLSPDAVKKQVYRLLKNLRGKMGDGSLNLFLLLSKKE
jgi:RNA polymerase sigma factor (sigma-70 family)